MPHSRKINLISSSLETFTYTHSLAKSSKYRMTKMVNIKFLLINFKRRWQFSWKIIFLSLLAIFLLPTIWKHFNLNKKWVEKEGTSDLSQLANDSIMVNYTNFRAQSVAPSASLLTNNLYFAHDFWPGFSSSSWLSRLTWDDSITVG